ncbi:MAG: rhamnulokinase [Phycisphaerae bacterium]|nr:rhamnulokinase [Phycisphaerae bacterium]NIS50993.1 rhamnulokinase [Phycisphaerae bacterium]NIU08643.1 rhamnulokinase [Phycisphaerae bacterium]NIU56226.1 rhamnulokinase [Phycisphaerae bacterium]NIV02341.1 rhamnulokinase [Phycisphaerae bacterium]
MAETKKYIAVDLGAESGRVMLGSISADKLALEEVHRFSTGPIEEAGTLRWDFERLLSEIKSGIVKAVKQAGDVSGIGVDSWGVDFGLLDADGELIEKPYHYRDSRTNEMLEKAFELMGKREIYENTGIQFMQLNSLYQVLAMRLANSEALSNTKQLIFIGDLFSYFLCGKAFGEYSLASTSQMMDMKTGQWSKPIFDKLSLPIDIMPDIVETGTVVGQLTESVADELGCGRIAVIATASHDTASAVAAVPAEEDSNWAYLSSGTWSLMGVEVPEAIVNDKTFQYEFTNEGGVENTIRLLKNIMGLWLVQECRRQWQREGVELSYAEMTDMAKKAEPFARHIEVDYSGFLAPGNMPDRINSYLAETGQKAVDDKGQMIRMILESLALKYRVIMERIEDITGQNIDCLHIVGGGIQNELLCQFTANAIGKKVVAGPIEATASGNLLIQAKATGQIKTLAELRKIVRNSFELKEYEPQEASLWEEQYKNHYA